MSKSLINQLGLFLNKIRLAEQFFALLRRKFNREQLYYMERHIATIRLTTTDTA